MRQSVCYFEGRVISPGLRSYCVELSAALQPTAVDRLFFSGTFSGQDTGAADGTYRPPVTSR